jgi:phospholipid/cholesterol/gamma-HCH transport system substrate-binding protein
LLNSQSRSPFVGLGMKFTNEDLKYFAGAASSIPHN